MSKLTKLLPVLAILSIFCLPKQSAASSGIYLDSTGYSYKQNADDGNGNFTFSNTISQTCENGFLMAIISTWADGNGWDSVAYGGVQMADSGIGSQAYVGQTRHMRWQTFVLANPPLGTRNFHFRNTRGQYSDPATIVLKAFCNVDQEHPLDFVRGGLSNYSGNGIGSGYFNITNDNSLVLFNYILATGGTVTGTPGFSSTSLNAYDAYGTQIYNFFMATVDHKTEFDYYYVGGTDTDWARSLDVYVLNAAAPSSNVHISGYSIDSLGNVSLDGTCRVIGTGQSNIDIYRNVPADPKIIVTSCNGQSGQPGTFSATYPAISYGTSTLFAVAVMENPSLNRDSVEISRALPPSHITILEPMGGMSIRGRTVELAGICEPYYVSGLKPEDAKLSTLALTSDFSPGMQGPIMDEPSCTCEPDPNNFLWGAFDCFYTSKDYTTKRVYVVDTMDYRNFDSRDFSFNDYNSFNLYLNPYFNISTEFGAEAKFKISPVEIYDTQGFNVNAVPLVITFDQDAMASSTSTSFYLYDYTVSTSSPTVLASSTISGLGLNGDRQIGYELDLSILHTRTLYGKVTDQSGKVLQGMSIIFNYHPLFFPTPPLDFGDIFPRIKNALKDKFIFHQFFYAYDTLLANFTKVVPEVVPQFPMKFISGDQQYNLTIPALDFESAPVKYFAQNLRPMGDGLLWLGFIVYIFFRIIGAFSPDDK